MPDEILHEVTHQFAAFHTDVIFCFVLFCFVLGGRGLWAIHPFLIHLFSQPLSYSLVCLFVCLFVCSVFIHTPLKVTINRNKPWTYQPSAQGEYNKRLQRLQQNDRKLSAAIFERPRAAKTLTTFDTAW